MRRFLRRFLHQDGGEGVAEYAVLIALIAACLIGIIQVMRNAIRDSIATVATDVSERSGGSYGSGGEMTAVPGPSYGGGGGSGGVSAPASDAGDDDDPAPPDSLGADDPGVDTAHR